MGPGCSQAQLQNEGPAFRTPNTELVGQMSHDSYGLSSLLYWICSLAASLLRTRDEIPVEAAGLMASLPQLSPPVGNGKPDNGRTLWIGDLSYHIDEAFLRNVFASTTPGP